MGRTLFLLIIMLFCVNSVVLSQYDKDLPVHIQKDDRVFMTVSSEISKNLPKGIQVLVYDIFFLNGEKELSDNVNKNFKLILSSQQFINDYTSLFIDDVKTNHTDIDCSFVKKMNDKELIAFGKNINADVVMISSATVIEGKYKNIWDASKRRFIKKRIVLFQSNIFNVENESYTLRLTDYFLVD